MDRPHYGWYIAIVCLFMTFGASLLSTGMAVTLSALRLELGFGGSETSLVMTIICAGAFIITFFSDRLYGRVGMRWGTALSMLSGMTAFLIFSVAGNNIYIYYIGALFGGFTYGLGMMLPSSILMRRWFRKNRGLALSICSSGTGLGVAIGSPILQALIDSVGLQISFYVEATYMLIIAIVLLIVVRDDPADIGAEPLGGKDWVSPVKSVNKYSKVDIGAGLMTVVIIATAITGFCGNPATSSLALNFNTLDMDPTMVSLGLSVYGFMLMGSKILFGWVVDRKGALFATVVFGISVVLGLFGCYYVGFFREIPFMFLCMALLGIGYPLTTLGNPNWANDFVSSENYPRAIKKLQMGYQIGSLVGSSVPGIIADMTGDYTLAFLMFSILFLIAIVTVAACYFYVDRKYIPSTA